VGQAVYAIDAFPDDDLLWRIEWIGGVGYNTSVPSEPQIDVCLAQLPKGEKNPLSARARSSQVEKRTVKIGVGLLPYVWIGSVWQKRRPRRSYSRLHAIIADSASFANSADRFANNFASDIIELAPQDPLRTTDPPESPALHRGHPKT